MATNYPGLVKKWMYVPLFLLLLLVLFIGVFTSRSLTRPKLALAPAFAGADANQTPADGNETAEQKQKASTDKKTPRPEHTHPAFGQRGDERARMVAKQIRARGIRDPNVLAALCTVPRHAFVRRSDLRRAYSDQPLPIGRGQTISQPYIVAYMTEALKLKEGDKVLEIGTGSGYQAAVCAEILNSVQLPGSQPTQPPVHSPNSPEVIKKGEVYTIEIIEELAKSAEERLKKLGYKNVFVKAADGYFGWKEKAPYDAIIGTAAAVRIPPPLLEQLKPGGRMILPEEGKFGFQYLVLLTKDERGNIKKKKVMPVRFVPMTGRVEKPDKKSKK